jgi:hypothetical protein
MRSENRRGGASVEFAFALLVLLPLLLGSGVTGANLIRTLQIVQLARDAGHMYARNIDFSLPGNQKMLIQVGQDLGLSTSGGSAVVILSNLTYVDKNACAAAGAVDWSGNPTSACTNYTKWVFTQRLVIGNAAVKTSNYGSPLTSGPTAVVVDPTTGRIPLADYVKKTGAVAQFSAINPYAVVGGVAQGLPSGQSLYLAEAAATGFSMPPFVSNAVTYAWGMF